MAKKNSKKNKRNKKKYQQQQQAVIEQTDSTGATDTHILAEGVVLSSVRGVIKVELDSGQVVKAHLHGNMKLHKINVLIDDRVSLKISPYDMERGIIMRRLKPERKQKQQTQE